MAERCSIRMKTLSAGSLAGLPSPPFQPDDEMPEPCLAETFSLFDQRADNAVSHSHLPSPSMPLYDYPGLDGEAPESTRPDGKQHGPPVKPTESSQTEVLFLSCDSNLCIPDDVAQEFNSLRRLFRHEHSREERDRMRVPLHSSHSDTERARPGLPSFGTRSRSCSPDNGRTSSRRRGLDRTLASAESSDRLSRWDRYEQSRGLPELYTDLNDEKEVNDGCRYLMFGLRDTERD
jgi:hypothetical protein